MMSDARFVPVRRLRLWLAALAVFAAVVRFAGLNWDQSHFFHPDERRIAFAVEELSFRPLQLNPHFFAYGSFPIYVTRAVTSLLGQIRPVWAHYDAIILTGRAVSAAVGTFTVILLVFLGARLYNRQVGLLAGFLLASSVLHVQNSHYMTTDVFLTFMVLVALYGLIGVVQRGAMRDYLYSGIAIGLAAATKFSALPLLAALGVAAVVRVGRERRLLPILARGGLAVAATALAFAAGQPYAFLDFAAYSRDIAEQSRMVRNAGLLPYTNQYIGTPKYVYELTHIILFGMAPPLGLAAIWATAARAVGVLRDRRAEDLVLLAWVVPFFLVTGWFEVKFVRYLLPIYPIMILWAAAWLWRQAERAWLGRAALWTVVAGTLLATLAFLSIYQRDHTVVTASEWVYRHVPSGSVILTQHWDEGFPMPLRGRNPGKYKVIDLPYYEPDTPSKMQQISRELARGDYIAFQTKRLYGAVTRAPQKYPLTNNYFYLLFAGDLGYTLVYDHAVRPGLFGLEVPVELLDESITVYDHPKVLIFQNTGRLSAEEIFDKITRGMPSRKLTRRDLLLAQAAEHGGVLESGAAAPPIRSSWPALLWFALVVHVAGVSAYPVLRRWLPVTGCYALAKVLGVLAFAYVPWLLASLGQADFTRGTLVTMIAVLVAVGIVAWRRRGAGPGPADWWPTEALFWGTFLFFLAVRAFNPEVFWGEKPMDFSFLNALTRASKLPPPEPWFAGSTLHYSYFGHFLVAALGKVCHLHPGLTFNLGVALAGGLTATAAFAAGCALSDRWRVGLLAAFFSTLIGNLSGLREIIQRRVVNFDYFWATSRVIKDTINEYPFWSFLFADLHAHVLVMPFSLTFVALALWWVRRHAEVSGIRSLPLLLLLGFTLGAITVTNTWSTFTYVAFFPFLLGCVSLARSPVERGRTVLALVLLACLGAVFGLERAFPALGGQLPPFLSALAARQYASVKAVLAGAALLVFLPGPVVATCAVAGLAYVFYFPYWRDWTSPPPNWGFEGDAFAHLWDFANIFGLFLFVGIPFLFALWRRQLLPAGRDRLPASSAAVVWLVGLVIAVALLVSQPAIHRWAGLPGVASVRTGLVLLAVLALHLALHRVSAPPQRLVAVLFSFAFFVTAGVDVVHIWDRMNTVFKFYMEAWFLFAIAAAAGTYELSRGLFQSAAVRGAWQAGLAVLLGVALFTAGTATYAVINTRRVETPRPTLDGTAYLPLRDPNEAAAFEWLNREIAGIPVIAEAYGPSYQDFARVSMNTGLPTVLGWDYHVHQRAQGWPAINRRKDDLKKLFTTDHKKTAADILQTYHVALVYVGGLERRTYAGGNRERFNQWTDLLTPAYQNAGVTVYAVHGQFTGAMPITTIEQVPQVTDEEVAPPAREGELSQPRGIAADSAGNIYVADFGNNRLQKFNAKLQFIAAWGEQGNLPSQFKQPGGIAVDATNTVYVADTWNQRIQVLTAEGQYLREWGGSFYGPRGIAVSRSGKVYLADTGNHRIRRFDTNGKEEATWGGHGSQPGQFIEPVGIATDARGRVYVCDNGNARLQIFDPDGKPEGSFRVDGWESKVFSEPHVTVAPSGIIWVTVPLARAVRAYDSSGKVLKEFVGTEDRSGPFQRPMGIALLPAGNELVISDLENRLVRIPLPKDVR